MSEVPLYRRTGRLGTAGALTVVHLAQAKGTLSILPDDQFPKPGTAIEIEGNRTSCALRPPLPSHWFHTPSDP